MLADDAFQALDHLLVAGLAGSVARFPSGFTPTIEALCAPEGAEVCRVA